jgi:hypothetical protein
MMPVPAIPRQARGFNAEYCSDLTATNLRDQALKAGAFDQTRSRFPEVVINSNDVIEAKAAGIVGEPVLTALAFEIVHNLYGRGLPNVYYSAAAEMIRCDLTQGSLLPSGGSSASATLSKRSAKTCSSSRRFSTVNGIGSSNCGSNDNCRGNGWVFFITMSPEMKSAFLKTRSRRL